MSNTYKVEVICAATGEVLCAATGEVVKTLEAPHRAHCGSAGAWQPTQAQAGAVPLDEARRLFDAGWKAAALFCDREDVVADGIIGFGACPQFEAAYSAATASKEQPND